MKRLTEFPLGDGSTILVEADVSDAAGATLRGVGSAEVVEKARDTFEAAVAKIRPAAEAIISILHDLSEKPDTVEVEFGLKLSATGGAVIASAAAEANFSITLTWKPHETAGA